MKVLLLTLAYYFVYLVSHYGIDASSNSQIAHYVFLPAGLRLLYALVFNRTGFAALFLGALITTVTVLDIKDPAIVLGLTLASSASPYVAVKLFLSPENKQYNLAYLDSYHLLGLGFLTTFISAFAHTMVAWYLMADVAPFSNFLTMLIGDIVGILIILYLAKFVLHTLKWFHQK